MPARLIAICIDAANPALLRKWAADGTLPVLGDLFRRGLTGDVLSLELEGDGKMCRLVLRPSGTEPKLKIYGLARSGPGIDPQALQGLRSQIDAVVDAVLTDAHAQIERAMKPFFAQ